MAFQLPALSRETLGVVYAIICAVATIVIASLPRGPNLDHIPTVGSSSWLGSWWAGFKYWYCAADIIQEGYEKYKSAPFKVADKYHWLVVLSDRKHIEEVRSAPDDVLSFEEATNEQLNSKYTLNHDISETEPPSIAAVVRTQLTGNIGTLYPEIRDEIVTAFDEVLALRDNEWKSIPALDVIRQVVCRTSNRLFVGLPLCRDPDWMDLNIRYAIEIIKVGATLGRFPELLKPLAAFFLTRPIVRSRARGLQLVGPIIEERLKYMNEYGKEWAGKPNDIISWIIEKAEGPQLTVKSLAWPMLSINFAAIHTSSNGFTKALFLLASNPEYIGPLRVEVESIIEKEGWSKDSLDKMHKVDSFLRENQRHEGNSVLSLRRKAMKDYTFSDGTFIPKGAVISVASGCLHHDEKIYENARVFKPFRFADMRQEDGESAKYQFTSTGPEYLPFGYGRHACPGRFFASSELKSMLAHVVVTYDIKLDGDATLLRSLRINASMAANPHAKVMIRKRVD